MLAVTHDTTSVDRNNWLFSNQIDGPVLRNLFFLESCLNFKTQKLNDFHLPTNESVKPEITVIVALSSMSGNISCGISDATYRSAQSSGVRVELKFSLDRNCRKIFNKFYKRVY